MASDRQPRPRRWTRRLLLAGVVALCGLAALVHRYGWSRVDGITVSSEEPVAHLLLDAHGHNRVLSVSHAAYLLRASHPSGGRLYYFGCRHTKDPDDPQIVEIVGDWDGFAPTLALLESRVGLFMGGLRRGVREFGEPGAVYALARRDGVPVHSLEPAPEDHVRALARATDPHTAAAFLAIRFASANHVRPFTDANIEEALRKRAVGDLAGVIEDAVAFDALWQERWAAELGDWRTWESSTMMHTRPDGMERIARESSKVRDVHMVRLLAEQVRAGEHVFAVVGRSHVAMQEPALRALLPEAEFTVEFLDHTWTDR